MKAKDLMIGDWIGARIQVDDTGSEPVYGEIPRRVTDLMSGNDGVYCNGVNQFDSTEFVPIPLTPEILEKNGFLVDSNGIFYLKENLKFGLKKDIDYGYWFINRADNYKEYICTCDFVHKLQHLLRDLEIEKEIVL